MITRETAAPMGTSLEILATYLPYGIEIQVKTGWGGNLDVMTGKLVGMTDDQNYPLMLRMFNQGGIKTFLGDWEPAMCLPVLRPFSQLCQPLEDGTVPAVEVAKLLVNAWAGEYRYAARATPHGFNIDVFGLAGYMEDDEVQEFAVLLYSDWDWEIKRVGEDVEYSPTHNPAQAIDYLRSKHFAVGLQESQFIPKAPTPTPA